MVRTTKYPFLMLGLLDAWEWFDDSLQTLVRNAGFKPLNRSQSLMMLYILMGVQRPTEIAKRARLSRQAIAHIASQLVEREIIVSTEDPTDRRSIVLSFATDSSGIRGFASDALRDLEDELRLRLGAEHYSQLVALLEEDWGEPVTSILDLSPQSRVAARAKTPRPPAQGRPTKSTFLILALLDAWEWFDNSLVMLVKNAGHQPLNRSQALVLFYIGMGVRRPVDIARRARLTRQAVAHIVSQLASQDFVEAVDDPADRRSTILRSTADPLGRRSFTRSVIRDLETELRERLGAESYHRLSTLLQMNWGEPVKSALDLPPRSRVADRMSAGNHFSQ